MTTSINYNAFVYLKVYLVQIRIILWISFVVDYAFSVFEGNTCLRLILSNKILWVVIKSQGYSCNEKVTVTVRPSSMKNLTMISICVFISNKCAYLGACICMCMFYIWVPYKNFQGHFFFHLYTHIIPRHLVKRNYQMLWKPNLRLALKDFL